MNLLELRNRYADHNFGMYTNRGGRRVRKMAFRLLHELAGHSHREAYLRFFKSYMRSWGWKNDNETSDTAVRECVFAFANECGKITGHDEDKIEEFYNITSAAKVMNK